MGQQIVVALSYNPAVCLFENTSPDILQFSKYLSIISMFRWIRMLTFDMLLLDFVRYDNIILLVIYI